MKIIVGLGNPGAQYASTPHSVGFEAVDRLVAALGLAWEEKRQFKCLWAKGAISGVNVIFCKPQTYMNLSGEAVAPLVKYSNAAAGDLIVVQDDIDLELGRLRIRRGGSCGGHNGIRNIIERLGSVDFLRVKIGVGKDRENVVAHVLGKFDPVSRQLADASVAAAADAVTAILSLGEAAAMNRFNAFRAELPA